MKSGPAWRRLAAKWPPAKSLQGIAPARTFGLSFGMAKLPFSAEDFFRANSGRAEWIGLRYVRERTTHRFIRNEKPDLNRSGVDEGAMVEVLIDGHFGHSATSDLSADGLKEALDRALAETKSASAKKVFHFSEAERPLSQGRYQSPSEISLAKQDAGAINALLAKITKAMDQSPKIVSRTAHAMLVETHLEFFSSRGSHQQQSFDLVHLALGATAVEGTESQSRHFSQTGQWGTEVFNEGKLLKEANRVGREALELLAAENCPSEAMDIILMPDQMMLQIHESIGHPLELDRILGDERNYAGWSFVQQKDFGNLRYGSDLMNISFDPAAKHEYASYAFDDSGTPATKEFLIEGGILKRGLGSSESQRRSNLKGVANFRASSWNRAPIDRMANINMEPGKSTLESMISSVKRGVLMHTNRSWSIDDYRNKFQFGCEYGQFIEEGKITRTVRNPNYRGTTVDFWNRLAAVGDSVEVHGTPYCGKGEPNQVIRVGHNSPPCLFKGVEVFGGES